MKVDERRARNGAKGGHVHVPVLGAAVVDVFSGLELDTAGRWIVDATVGAGGHAALVLEALPDVHVLGLDQDPQILEHAHARLAGFGSRVRLVHGRASRLDSVLGAEGISEPVGVLLDLGASSLQLDSYERGFSFQQDGPLDMRMDPTRDRTAADIVNRWDEGDLADLFYYEGGERESRRIARAIVAARRNVPFLRTGALADLCERELGRSGRLHPGTRVFQALRRAVNEEGEELERALPAAENVLVDEGRLVVISFHSGEDRQVKRFLADGMSAGRWDVIGKKPRKADRAELRTNVRARSAVLRAAVRTRSDRPERLERTEDQAS